VQALATTVEVRDPYTAGHQRRVAKLAVAIATEMRLPPERIEGLQLAAVLHDIGKIHVPAEILASPRKLTAAEFEIIKTHPTVGYDILKDIDFTNPVARIVLQHHERLDGSGYPAGLKQEQILLEARILCVADVVEAMASHRPYRPGLGVPTALHEISEHKGQMYDSDVVSACVGLFQSKQFEL
jgi:putative nucleotidyltransferase with HDIG domain